MAAQIVAVGRRAGDRSGLGAASRAERNATGVPPCERKFVARALTTFQEHAGLNSLWEPRRVRESIGGRYGFMTLEELATRLEELEDA
ncbi:MAG TPA: hypothetical protein VE288_09145 [Rubrobacteraceae bacterium]|nr:hypothetical protein [Rubrobacteraceae bacterium]